MNLLNCLNILEINNVFSNPTQSGRSEPNCFLLHSNPHWKDLGAPKDELFRVGQTAIFWNDSGRWYTPLAYESTLEQIKDYGEGVVHIQVNELHTL